jgi:membrane associated rhomboid family serine protease
MKQFRRFPATSAFGLCWIVVFIAMAVRQGGIPLTWNLLANQISPLVGWEFGAQTTRAVLGGQPWRSLTATFVHYSVLHLVSNLLGLYLLGRLVEAMYGSRMFVGLYVLIAIVGNVLAAVIKLMIAIKVPSWIPFAIDAQSGGGSEFICGLVGLLAVTGWKARSAEGSEQRSQMVVILLVTAALGGVFPLLNALLRTRLPHVDNFGHALGAVVGALIGLGDRLLVLLGRSGAKRWIGATAVLVLMASGGLQAWADHMQARLVRELQARQQERNAAVQTYGRLLQLKEVYPLAALVGPQLKQVKQLNEPQPWWVANDQYVFVLIAQPVTDPASAIQLRLRTDLQELDKARSRLAVGRSAEPFRRLRELVAAAIKSPPKPAERALFLRTLPPVIAQAQRNIEAAGAKPALVTFTTAPGPPKAVEKREAPAASAAQPVARPKGSNNQRTGPNARES